MIEIKNLTKEFRVYKRRFSMLKELFGYAKPDVDYDLVSSLNDINISIPEGSVHGVIGMNGAGKSTLLKILTGVLDPSSGTFNVSGRVAALLELGTGFHGELTGRENIYVNGAIMGLSHDEIDSKIQAIQDFAELGDFFDRPVKIYSSGMYVRLAFAFAISVEPDVLIIDEALSVGDAYFQQKCLKKIRSFKESGTTILFVSHDLGAVKMLCESVTLLDKGSVLFHGTPVQALDLYNALLAEHQNKELVKARKLAAAMSDPDTSFESGTREAEVVDVVIKTSGGESSVALVTGTRVAIHVKTKIQKGPMDQPTCGILIRDRLGYDIFGVNTDNLSVKPDGKVDGEVEYVFNFDLNIGPGDYTLTVALHSDRSHIEDNYHWIERALIFKVLPAADFEFIGVTRLSPEVEILR